MLAVTHDIGPILFYAYNNEKLTTSRCNVQIIFQLLNTSPKLSKLFLIRTRNDVVSTHVP